MQAIETKYLPPTNVRGSRIKATCDRGSLTIDYPHEFNAEDGHRHAAKLLCAKFVAEDKRRANLANRLPEESTWELPFITGGAKNSYVHVFVGRLLNRGLKALRAGERGGAVMGDLSLALDDLNR